MTETEVVGALLLPQDTAHIQKIVNTITLNDSILQFLKIYLLS